MKCYILFFLFFLVCVCVCVGRGGGGGGGRRWGKGEEDKEISVIRLLH